MRRSFRGGMVLAVLFYICLPQAAEARSWRVEQDGSGEFETIQPAVDAAASGDTILIGPGRYQDRHEVIVGGHTTQVVVYSPLEKSLTYIGAGVDDVQIGPEAYGSEWYGSCGILHCGGQNTYVKNVAFESIYYGITSCYNVYVEACKFSDNKSGIYLSGSGRFIDGYIADCLFEDGQDNRGGIAIWSGGDIVIERCIFRFAVFSFNGTLNAQVRNCELYGFGGDYYNSNGEFVNNIVSLAPGPGVTTVSIADASQVSIVGNEISGGWYNLRASGVGVSISLLDNVLSGGQEYTIKCTSYASISGHNNHILLGDSQYAVRLFAYSSAYPASVDLRNNYWGTTDPDEVADMIYDGNDDPFVEMVVDYLPIADGPLPTEETTWGGLKALYKGGE